jgi:UDP-N-acetylmuramyl tripeptide synthase
MAATAADAMGIAPRDALDAFAAVDEVGGRYSVVSVGATKARLLLAKNPAGWLETLELLQPPPATLTIAINANAADGRDPSWLWDVPFEAFGDRQVFVSGERAEDLALRLHYAEVPFRMMPRDPAAAVRALPSGDADVVANYSAFRRLLSLRDRSA